MVRSRKKTQEPVDERPPDIGSRRQRGRLLQREGDPRAPRLDAAVGRRTSRSGHRSSASAGVDLGDGARVRRRAPATVRRPRALSAVGRLRRADRLLLRAAARNGLEKLADTGRPGQRVVRGAARHRSRNSLRSTIASPRSRSRTPRKATRPSLRSSVPKVRLGTGTRASGPGARSASTRSSASTAIGSTKSHCSSRSSRRRSRRSDLAGTCSRWRTATVRACSIPRSTRCPTDEVLEADRVDETRGVAMRGTVTKKGNKWYVIDRATPIR